MNPKPLASLNHFTVPCSITIPLFLDVSQNSMWNCLRVERKSRTGKNAKSDSTTDFQCSTLRSAAFISFNGSLADAGLINIFARLLLLCVSLFNMLPEGDA